MLKRFGAGRDPAILAGIQPGAKSVNDENQTRCLDLSSSIATDNCTRILLEYSTSSLPSRTCR